MKSQRKLSIHLALERQDVSTQMDHPVSSYQNEYMKNKSLSYMYILSLLKKSLQFSFQFTDRKSCNHCLDIYTKGKCHVWQNDDCVTKDESTFCSSDPERLVRCEPRGI